MYNSKLKVILKSSGGRNMERLVSERVWPGYSGVNMDKGIPGRRKAEGPAYAKALELEGACIWENVSD